jgi:hypothetical protein
MLTYFMAPVFLVLALFSGAHDPGPQQDPIVWSQVDKDGVVSALHQDGTLTASKLTEEGVLVTSTSAEPPQGGGTSPTPVVTTTYTGQDHSTHTITTPIASTTPAGLAAAMQTHKALVALMKVSFPPLTP